MAFFSSTSPLWVCLRTRTDPSPNPNERSLETSAGLAQALCYILAWKRSKQNKRSEWARPFLIVLHFYLSPLILHKAQQPIYPILCKNNISLSSLSLTHVVLLINTCILLLYSYQPLPPSPLSKHYHLHQSRHTGWFFRTQLEESNESFIIHQAKKMFSSP